MVVGKSCQPERVRRKKGAVCRKDEGAGTTDDTSEETELKDDVISWNGRGLPAALTDVVRRSYENGEVGPMSGVDERVERVLPRLKDSLVPENHLTVG